MSESALDVLDVNNRPIVVGDRLAMRRGLQVVFGVVRDVSSVGSERSMSVVHVALDSGQHTFVNGSSSRRVIAYQPDLPPSQLQLEALSDYLA